MTLEWQFGLITADVMLLIDQHDLEQIPVQYQYDINKA